jgi:Flp pilus assembly protein CpaB
VQHVQKLLSTRGGTIAVSAFAALVAALIFIVYLHRYQSSVDASTQPMTVLIAKSLIEKGTPGAVLGSEDLYERTTVPRDELHEGAVADPTALKGRVAIEDVYPGEQLTTGAFTASAAERVGHKLTKDQRAISVPVDSAHGLVGHVQAGDYVDVTGSYLVDRNGERVAVVKTILQDVLVLDAPAEAARAGVGPATATSRITLRMTDEQAADVAFTADNGKLWISLRPKAGEVQSKPDLVTIETILLGTKPLIIRGAGGEQR